MQALIGPLSWLLLSEMFPLRTRSFAMGFPVFMLWLVNGLVTLGCLPVVTAVGVGPTFGIFALLDVIAIWFMVHCLPETSSKTFETVEAECRAHREWTTHLGFLRDRRGTGRAHREWTTRNPAHRARFVGRAGVSSVPAGPFWQALTS